MAFDVRVTFGKTTSDIYEANRQLNKAHQKIFDLLSLLESIMIHSDIDNDKENAGLTTWKQKIMKELIEHGYAWDGDAHEANQIFGENYGIDWK